jgi:type VI secretion system secreted protein VgrG
MEQEGIFWFFADGEDGEKLILADGMDGLPFGRSSHDGRVPHRGAMAAGTAESVFDLHHAEELGPTSATIREYDWTNPSLDITAQQSSDSPLDPAPEVYDHTDAVSFHWYDGRQYGHHTASRAAQIRLEHLTLMRQRWSMHGNVLTAMPGHVLRVEGAPQGDLDGSYMIVRVESGGVATEGGTGTWVNSLVVVPTSVPYRSSPSTPRPVVPGPETATVVGPDGQEIHTDEHGRVKVHFHWDRVRGRTDAESSCWIRVAQNWAGAGFGTFFLPRIGMEVVVSFLGGNPERPLVTGCVYNGANASPASPLPAKKTQSVIRTKSSLNSDGYNELRFEDEAGREFVSLHAQRNLLERVLHDHRTHVGHNQRNQVDNDQEITVHGNRTRTIDGDETIVVKGTRDARIGEDGGDDKLWVINNQEVQIDGNRTLEVAFGDTIHVRGIRQDTVDGGITTTVQHGGVRQTINSGGWTMTTTGNVSHTVTGGMIVDTSDGITMNAGANVSIDGATGVEVSGQSITLTTPTTASVNATGGVNVQSQGAIVLNSNTDIQMNSPQSLLENINAKIGAYSLAMSVYGIKADVSGIKADEQAVVIKNGKFEAGTVGVHIRNMVANIRKGAAHIIG